VVLLKAGVRHGEIAQRSQEESGADQQRKGKRDLRNDEPAEQFPVA
jgi:hypothetical protein